MDQQSLLSKKLVELHFTTKGATKNSFFRFISLLRDQLASGEVSNEIPLMQELSTSVWECERYFLVRLTNNSGYSISLGIDIINAHVVAYGVGDLTFFFCNSSPSAWHCLASKENDSLPFRSNYISLQQTAKVLSRGEIPLGLTELNGAITNLYSDRDSRRLLVRS
ncbi:beta-galactoside-specific lectin 3-like [Diospyros lotus]|uniref:beta-galactoside-specific lectin 3-like n=1 Tax=Diospyros lotus TaxID=55363 RepID=UPI00225849A6|nr:beta-galactoside-specific lectin 3-like [Diospyros lotus]